MTPQQIFIVFMVTIVIALLLLHVKGGIEDKIDLVRSDIDKSSHHFGEKISKLIKDQDELKRQSSEIEQVTKDLDVRLNNLDTSTREELMARLHGASQALEITKGDINARMDKLQVQTQEELVRALVKADNAFTLAHQASVAVKDSQVFRLKFEPMKMRVRMPKGTVGRV